MKKYLNKFLFGFMLLAYTVVNAQVLPPEPPEPVEQSYDIGAPSNSIDMYLFLLVVCAISLAVYYKRRLSRITTLNK